VPGDADDRKQGHEDLVQARLDRAQVLLRSIPIQKRIFALAERHLDSSHREVRNLATALFEHNERLFTFLEQEGVEPTNNSAERALRTGVQWRKICCGNRSVNGEIATARLLTVAETCELQRLNILGYPDSTYLNCYRPELAVSNPKKQARQRSSGARAETHQKCSALQLHRNRLKRLIAQVFWQMFEGRKVHHLSVLSGDLFCLAVRIREPDGTQGYPGLPPRGCARPSGQRGFLRHERAPQTAIFSACVCVPFYSRSAARYSGVRLTGRVRVLSGYRVTVTLAESSS
jgi:hypothetical protein